MAFLSILRQEKKKRTTDPTKTPEDSKNKRQLILTYIGGGWYIKKSVILNPQQKYTVEQ